MVSSYQRLFGKILKFRALVVVRSLLYLTAIGFIFQHLYSYGDNDLYAPHAVVAVLALLFVVNILLIPFMADAKRTNALVAVLFISDLAAITCVVLASGGFRSIFITYYLLILVIASLWLPRRYTALFPSAATLGLAVVGATHMFANQQKLGVGFLPREFAALLRGVEPTAAVSNMLLLTLLFFVIAYLAGVVGDNLTLEQRLNSEILANMGEGVAFADNRGRLLYRNAELCRLFPELDAAVDLDDLALVMFGSPYRQSPLGRVACGAPGESFVFAIGRNEIAERPPMEIRATRISPDGRDKRAVLFLLVIDLSPRFRIAAAERSIEKFSAISMMATGLAHEIRNPLASVRSAVQELMSAYPEDSDKRVLADLVLSESDRLDGIITRFLTFSRDEPLALSVGRLGPVLEEVRHLLERREEAAAVRIAVVIEDDPEIVCDANRLKEVFLNLGLNAVQLARPADAWLEIRLRRATLPFVQGVEVEFADNGPGVDPDELGNVFQPFYSRRQGGTGMGLALARKQVEAHGGSIAVKNRVGGGAVFTVWLPLAAEDVQDARQSARQMVNRIHRYKDADQ
ncbi:MAG: hypothetical protein LBT97_03420 [Planctomycetota bacterium]|nr:hypothetical protein [Planctomycetota bacterium]